MPRKIKNFPETTPETTPIVLVGIDPSTQTPEAIDGNVFWEIAKQIRLLSQAITKGNKIKDVISLDLGGAIQSIDLTETMLENSTTTARYRHASAANTILIRLRKPDGKLTGSELRLAPGAEVSIERHLGFEARVEESAPALLDIILYEGERE